MAFGDSPLIKIKTVLAIRPSEKSITNKLKIVNIAF
jgi:hypothetical protein